ERLGSRLILRRGDALTVLSDLIRETRAGRVVWSRLYDTRSIAPDKAIKKALGQDGIEAVSVNGSLLFEPWTVETGQGGFYKVYSPFWRAVRGRDVGDVLPRPGNLAPPDTWPGSDSLDDWELGRAMDRGAGVVGPHARVGEAAARDRLGEFIDGKIATYKERRNFLAEEATSGLSENLAYGEISPRQIWHAGWRVMETGPSAQAEHFLKELVWREFAYHLLFHTPHIATRNWREEWDGFPWAGDNEAAGRWRRGMTGVEVVDAAMRQLYVTGTMHNRARMVVASFLTKHLLTDWRIGEAWFRDCLIDWDPASNAMGWQWTAGSGPDAAPYFRIFNPESQAEKFDPDGAYRNRYLAEGRTDPHADALAFFDAVPRSWGLSPGQ
ncbi:MAG: deoxyribodipyrimidine photo-lyase, partial [Xanthomonadales bacterium]|nr:deoxyribodipyrimidine photo-lyase [Xanthomonadales bacterium]